MLSNKVRIIGGQWRGRKLNFPDVQGLRPTADRIRETLFNWLTPTLHGARCLDVFAGSGALGFEAASRGAVHVTLLDDNPKVVTQLRANQELLKAENIRVYQISVPKQKFISPQPFDIVFLDPPFHQNLIESTCQWLINQQYLAPSAIIYLETEAELAALPIPESWEILKAKQAGQVKYYLLKTS